MDGLLTGRIARPVRRDWRYSTIYIALSQVFPLYHAILPICRHLIANYSNVICFLSSDDVTNSFAASLEAMSVAGLLSSGYLKWWRHQMIRSIWRYYNQQWKSKQFAATKAWWRIQTLASWRILCSSAVGAAAIFPRKLNPWACFCSN